MYILLILIHERIFSSDDIYTCESEVIFDSDITVIETYSFEFCKKKQETFSFRPNPQLRSIEEYAFEDCENLKFIDCSKLINIGVGAFQGCIKAKYLKLPSSVETIEILAFSNIPFSELNISHLNKLKIIRDFVFFNSGPEIMILPEGLEIIEFKAFYSNLFETITLPSTVVQINEDAFESCSRLKTIIFPENSSLKFIGLNAFYRTPIESLVLPKKLSHIN